MTDATTTTETTTSADATALGSAGDASVQAATPDAAVPEATEATETTALNADPSEAAKPEAETKADDAPKVEVPETYELQAPEGFTLDAKMVEAASPVFKELGLSNEQANKLVPVAAQFAQQIADNLNQQIISQVQADRKAWLDTAKSDPEIGGANWEKTIATGAQALDRLGYTKGSSFRNLLDESGLGNHPEMIRMFAKVGKAISEDSFERGAGNAAPPRSQAQILYGSKES